MDYMDKYNFWLTSPQFDEETRKELEAIKGNDLEIKDRFYKDLEFGTGEMCIRDRNTVSHSMTCCALQEAKKCGTCVARIHTSSANALHEILKEHCNSCSENGECACLKNA